MNHPSKRRLRAPLLFAAITTVRIPSLLRKSPFQAQKGSSEFAGNSPSLAHNEFLGSVRPPRCHGGQPCPQNRNFVDKSNWANILQPPGMNRSFILKNLQREL